MLSINEQDAHNVLERFYHRVVPSDASLRTVTNGMSNASIWQVASHESDWALRCWGHSGPGIKTVRRISEVLRFAARNKIDFVPAPVQADNHAREVEYRGALWELAPWMPGQPAEEGDSPAKLSAAFSALREMHDAMRAFEHASGPLAQPSPAIRDRQRKIVSAATVDWQEVTGRATRNPEATAVVDDLRTISQLLARAIPIGYSAVTPSYDHRCFVQPVIRDVRREHFLFTGDRVTGLVDFGAMTIDSQAVDVARLLGDWVADDFSRWLLAIDHFQLHQADRTLLGPLDASGVVLSCCNWLRWIAGGRPAPTARIRRLRGRLECLVTGDSPFHKLLRETNP